MKGLLFKSKGGEQFYYSPLTGRIIQLPEEVTRDKLAQEDFKFKFGYDKDRVRKVLSSNLENLILEGTQDCNLRCGYCIYGGEYIGERNHQAFSMSLDVAQQAATFFLDHSKETRPIRVISFYGG